MGSGLGTAQLLLVPLHLPCLGPFGHWALLVADMVAGTITAYDPLGYSRNHGVSSLKDFLWRYADADPEELLPGKLVFLAAG